LSDVVSSFVEDKVVFVVLGHDVFGRDKAEESLHTS
jgi:hypothetical protein